MLVNTFLNTSWLTFSSSNVNPCSASFNVLFAMKRALPSNSLPVLFVVKVICILGNLLTNVVSYVIGLLLLVIGGSAIYCIVKALWQSLLILVVLGIATIAAVFLLVWAVMKVENIGESLGAFIRS